MIILDGSVDGMKKTLTELAAASKFGMLGTGNQYPDPVDPQKP
jgi:hypothetical protein